MDEAQESTKDLKAWSICVAPGQASRFVDDLLESEESSKANILALRADMVFGMAHLRSALYHARKAQAEGRNASDSLPMETLLYASGERQLGAAIDKMTVTDETERIVVASLNGGAIRSADSRSWTTLPDTDDSASTGRLMAFGISKQELDTCGRTRPEEIVLERVAAVDILKK